MMPPLPPPSGMSATAHFQVIQVASARTMSNVSDGWKRMPPLLGPRASLCWTRKPSKTLIEPSSMLHRDAEVVLAHRPAQHFGDLRVEVELLGHLVELLLRHFEFIELFSHDYLLLGLSSIKI